MRIVPYKGCYVLPLNKNKLLQVYSLRKVIETFAAEQGVEAISKEAINRMESFVHILRKAEKNKDYNTYVENDFLFHKEIILSVDNIILEKMWNLVGPDYWSWITLSANFDLSFFTESHGKILDMIKDKNTSGVISELARHFDTAASYVIKKTLDTEDSGVS